MGQRRKLKQKLKRYQSAIVANCALEREKSWNPWKGSSRDVIISTQSRIDVIIIRVDDRWRYAKRCLIAKQQFPVYFV